MKAKAILSAINILELLIIRLTNPNDRQPTHVFAFAGLVGLAIFLRSSKSSP